MSNHDSPIAEPLLTYREVAEYTGVTERQVYNWCHREGLPCFKLGRNVRIDPADLRAWLAERKTSSNAGGAS